MEISVDTAIAVAIISGLVSISTIVATKLLSRVTDRAQANRDRGDAATKLSDAAAKQIQTYNDEVISPLLSRITHLEEENLSLKSMLVTGESARKTYVAQIEELQYQHKTNSQSIDSQRQQITILIEQSSIKERVINSMQKEIEQLRKENEELRVEILELRNENSVLRENGK